MLEGLLFILLILISGSFVIIAFITMLIGFIKKSSSLKKTALTIAILPIICWLLIAFWYLVTLPSFNKSDMENFAGTYTPNTSFKANKSEISGPKLILSEDGTYLFDGLEGIGLKKQGTWKTGGNDGLVEFYDKNGNLSEWASPYGNNDDHSLSFEYRGGQDPETILFVKIRAE
ncbi:hypothetical protein [Chryseobacterium sp. NKUCC03_KSP]|uniref:hypothetical protein n=1 Tax=Chryseobacterium sp. NKUCC03_KSP TaxID=2842125 RepID=UPI001C5AFC73|nr:hypothetical protein [Chryseobacterium sp. NKUCC03_KSP]MBW3521367.1 hypothetical protein [Chryseobacterium sp. NKUCC03_KSP]